LNLAPNTQNRMHRQCILIVDRDPGVSSALADYFSDVGFSVYDAATRDEATALIKDEGPSLIIIDLQLDSEDGFMVMSQLRQLTNAPIIVTAARYDQIDKISALEGGADDYIDKRCSPRELLAHVRARLRRFSVQKEATSSAEIVWSDAIAGRALDPNRAFKFDAFIYPGLGYDLTTLNGRDISLSARELSFLRLLAENPQRPIPFDEIARHIYRGQENVERRTSVMVSRLRSKLEPHTATHPIIVCKPNAGYKLNVAVESAA
jgi:DNA-binding response OmpR family regulator